MGAATGLTAFDVALLEAFDAVGARHDRPFVKSWPVLLELHARTGVGPRYAYEALCDHARPWVSRLRMVDMHGNIGSQDGVGPADPEFVECRLTRLGSAALAAERGELGPLPVGLINGDIHTGGARPPLDPRRVVTAIRAAASATDDEVAAVLGRPSFPTACDVEIDVEAWAAGRGAEMTLCARIEPNPVTGTLVVSHLPPDSTTGLIADAILSAVDASEHPATRSIRDVAIEHADGEPRIAVHLRPGADMDHTHRFLMSLHGLRQERFVPAGPPAADLVRRFDDPDRAALDARLAIIESAITRPR